jgi:hypothetical protein
MKTHLLFLVLATVASLNAQEKPAADPYIKDPSPTNLDPRPVAGFRNLSICCETFSLPLSLAAKLRRDRVPDAELYARLGAQNGKDGIRQESYDLVRCMSKDRSQRAIAESISELIYPTEYVESTMPATVGIHVMPSARGESTAAATNLSKAVPPAEGDGGLLNPITPAAFDTRNVGRTFEVEGTMSDGPLSPFVNLRLVPEIVSYVGREVWGQGISQAAMPIFECQRLNTSITVRINQPTMLGTMSRPSVSRVDPDSAKRVWLTFVTVKMVQP